MQVERQNAKIINIIQKMDEMICKNGYLQYQERCHRIYKTLLSIQRHSDCIVSKFSCSRSSEPPLDDVLGETIESCNYNSSYLSLNEDNESQVENEDEKLPYKLELDNLLHFIEKELNIKNLTNDSTSLSSIDEDEEAEGAKMAKDNIAKKFFKIELKLRAYIEEQEYSILNSTKDSATPLSKITNLTPLPAMIKNFFLDKESIQHELQKAKKRFSYNEEYLKCDLASFHICDSLKKQSISEQPVLKVINSKNEVSNFNINIDNSGKTTGNNEGMMFNFYKRNSIFNEKHISLGLVQEDGISVDEEDDSDVSDIEESQDKDI